MRSGNTSTPSTCNYDNVIQPYPRARVKSALKYLVLGMWYLDSERGEICIWRIQIRSTKYQVLLLAGG